MKLILKITVLLSALLFAAVSCDSAPSLQKYYVDSKENSEFMSVDLPASILQLKDTEVSDDVKNTLETIKKINFLALQLTEDNKNLVSSERQKVKTILKNPKYKQLMRMNMGGGNVSVNYLGEENAIDEVVIFGADSEKGLALVRVIGENMDPSEILKLISKIQLDNDSGQLKELEGLFKSLN